MFLRYREPNTQGWPACKVLLALSPPVNDVRIPLQRARIAKTWMRGIGRNQAPRLASDPEIVAP
jgi:hypothetical protein